VTTETWGEIYRLIELVLIPFGIYLVRMLTAVTSDLKELKTVLIGIDGKNGIRSRVIRVERRIERLAAAQAQRHGEEDDDDDV
jgi:hypothetical protein